jgi:hypothetical protein
VKVFDPAFTREKHFNIHGNNMHLLLIKSTFPRMSTSLRLCD